MMIFKHRWAILFQSRINTITRFHCFLFLMLSFLACKDDNKYFQLIITSTVTDIDNTGATLNAKFLNTTDEKITEYGFTWGFRKDLSITNPKIILSNPLTKGLFSYRIDKELYPDTTYYVTAFVIKNGTYFYGSTVTFIGAGSNSPVITDFEPKSAYAGDIISISGNYFSSSNSNNIIYLNNKKLTPFYSSETLIEVVVPYDFDPTESKLSLEVSGVRISSSGYLKINETWTKTDEKSFSTYPVNGFLIGDNLFMRYADGYAGFFAYNLASGSLSTKTDYYCYVPSVMFSINDKGYLLFPTYSNCIDHLKEYNPNTNSWTEKSGFPGELRSDAVSFVIGRNAYFGLGYNMFTNKTLNDFWKYDSEIDIWSRVSDFPGPGRARAASFTYNNKGYAGLGGSMTRNVPDYNDLWEYDPGTNGWKKTVDYPGSGKSGLFAVTLKGRLYTGLKDFWIYDFISGNWKQIGDFPGTQYVGNYNIPFVANDTIYVGSMMSNNKFTIWKLDRYE
jgi:hypothetical protein